MLKKPTFAIVLETRKPNKNNEYPIKLRVTYFRKPRTYSLKKYLTIEDFEKLSSTKLRDERLKDIRFENNEVLAEAKNIGKSLNPFTFKKFKEQMFEKPEETNTLSIKKLYNNYIKDLKDQGKVSTYQSYECSLKSILGKKEDLLLTDITVAFLKNYEKGMLANEKSISTVGIYLRPLRAIYNKAISEGLIDQTSYPFNKNKYQIPSSQNIKKALPKSELRKIIEYKPIKGTKIDEALSLWKFSYLANGMNFKDICNLKYKDLNGSTLSYVRQKTKTTTIKAQKKISMELNPFCINLINQIGNKDKTASNYIFPFFNKKNTPEAKKNVLKDLIKKTNKYMNKLAKELDIDVNLTTYVARHSFSTMLKWSGVSTEYISEALGHRDLKTTENYLDNFETETKKKYSEFLTNFN